MADINTIEVISTDPAYHEGQPFTINESDFDPKLHKRFPLTDDAGDSGAEDEDQGESADAKPKGKAKK